MSRHFRKQEKWTFTPYYLNWISQTLFLYEILGILGTQSYYVHCVNILRIVLFHKLHKYVFSGKSPFGFADDSHLLEDGSLDQTVPNMNSPSRGSPNSQSGLERIERFSRKVFVGGLPPDIDEGGWNSVLLFNAWSTCSHWIYEYLGINLKMVSQT